MAGQCLAGGTFEQTNCCGITRMPHGDADLQYKVGVGRWVGGPPPRRKACGSVCVPLRVGLPVLAHEFQRLAQAPLWILYCPEVAFPPLRPLGGPRGRRGLQACAFGNISCKCALNVSPYVWRVCPMLPQYRWRRRILLALRTKRSHLDTAVSVRASRNRRACIPQVDIATRSPTVTANHGDPRADGDRHLWTRGRRHGGGRQNGCKSKPCKQGCGAAKQMLEYLWCPA